MNETDEKQMIIESLAPHILIINLWSARQFINDFTEHMRSSGDVSYLDKDKMLYELVLFSLWNLITMKCPDYLLSAIIHDFVEIRGLTRSLFE